LSSSSRLRLAGAAGWLHHLSRRRSAAGDDQPRPRRLQHLSREVDPSARVAAVVRELSSRRGEHDHPRPRQMRRLSRATQRRARRQVRLPVVSRPRGRHPSCGGVRRLRVLPSSTRTEGHRLASGMCELSRPPEPPRAPRGERTRRMQKLPRRPRTAAIRPRDLHHQLPSRPTQPSAPGDGLRRLPRLPEMIPTSSRPRKTRICAPRRVLCAPRRSARSPPTPSTPGVSQGTGGARRTSDNLEGAMR